SRVFILGAGASCFAKYPLAFDLWTFVRDNAGHHAMAASRKQEVVSLVERALKIVPPDDYDRPNLEHLFTLFDFASSGVAPLLLDRTDWIAVRPKLIGMMGEAFLHHQYSLQVGEDPKLASVLHKWTRYLTAG